MQRVRTLVWTPKLGSFPIHSMTEPARRLAKSITLIGPPAIDTEIKDAFVVRPVATHGQHVGLYCRRTFIFHRAGKVAVIRFDDDVQDNTEMHGVQLINMRLGVRKIRGVECEFRVGSRESSGGLFYVPARGCETGSKVNKRVARQFPVPEVLCDGFDRLKPVKRAVRLLVTQHPQRCHFGVAGDPCVLLHYRRRFPGANHKNVERQSVPGGLKLTFGPGQIKRAQWAMDKHCPAIGANQPLDWDATSVRRQLVSSLTAAVGEGLPFSIELRTAFAETEQWSFG